MTAWRECNLGDLIEIKHGFAFLGKYFGSAGTHVVLTPGNFLEEGGFKEQTEKAKWYTGPVPEDYVLKEGDVIVAMTEQAEGLLGSSALVPRSGVYLHNQRLGLVQIRDQKQTDKHFVYYLFNSKPVRQQIRASASGTKIRHTAPSRIAAVKVRIPPLPIQRRIAGILAAYDDLIENNQRRIKILEEMARSLYREWFVNFRFPGNEKVPLVDSQLGKIPKGWEVRKLGNCCDIVMGQSPKSEFYNDRCEGLPFHQGVTHFGELFPTDRVYCTLHTRIAEKGDILFSVRAPVGRLNLSTKKIVIGRGVSAIRSKTGQQSFIFVQLKETFKVDDAIGSGTIFKSVTRKDMEGIDVLIPTDILIYKFEEFANPLFSELECLITKNTNLRETRDLLLSKLIPGEYGFVTAKAHAI